MKNLLLYFHKLSICNSRPLSPLSSDPSDLHPLTPGHFLVGRPLLTINEPDVTQISESRLSLYQRIQALQQHFWSRWSHEYITSLQERNKWKRDQANLKLGQLVVIKDDNLPPLRWKLGRVADLHPGSDGISRVASIRTSAGIVRRAFTKICPLPDDNNTPIV